MSKADQQMMDELEELTGEQKAELDRRLADHERNPESAIPWEQVRREADLAPLAGVTGRDLLAQSRFSMWMLLFWALAGALFGMVLPGRLARVRTILFTQAAPNLLVGLATLIIAIPLIVLLALTLIGVVFAAPLALAFWIAWIFGTVAVGSWLGYSLTGALGRIGGSGTVSPVLAAALGTALLGALEQLPWFGLPLALLADTECEDFETALATNLLEPREAAWIMDTCALATLDAKRVQWAAAGFRPRAHYGRGKVALAGDAVGYFHPMTAAGMSLGLADAECVAESSDVASYRRHRDAKSWVPELLACALYLALTLGKPLLIYNEDNGTPWHRLGRSIKGLFNLEEMRIAEPDLFFHVEKRPAYTTDALDGYPSVRIPGWMATVRTDTNEADPIRI
jgi:putative addiction module component (TIGR02574 family)